MDTQAMRQSKFIVTLQFTDVMMNEPGTYQASFHIKSSSHVPTKYEPDDLFTFVNDSEKAIMQPWKQSINRDEPVVFCENVISVEMNENFVDNNAQLIVMVFKIEEENYTKSLDMVAEAEIMLKPCKSIFLTNEPELNRTQQKMIHLIKKCPISNINFHVGSMKYTYLVMQQEIFEDIIEVNSEISQDIISVSQDIVSDHEHEEEFIVDDQKSIDSEIKEQTTSILTPSSPTPSSISPSVHSSPATSSIGNENGLADVIKENNNQKEFDESVKDLYIRRKTLESALGLDIDLPDINAIQLLLPKYKSLVSEKEPSSSSKETTDKQNESDHSKQQVLTLHGLDIGNKLNLSQEEKDKLGSHVLTVLDYQKEEIERLCKLVQKMGDDVMILRNQKANLEREMAKVETDVYINNIGDGDEKVDPAAYFKKKLLAEETSKLHLQTRIYNLQSEIIKKNEMEVCYLELQKKYQTQELEFQKLQRKVERNKKLENTCRRQEQVIREMEDHLNEQLNDEAKNRKRKSVSFNKDNETTTNRDFYENSQRHVTSNNQENQRHVTSNNQENQRHVTLNNQDNQRHATSNIMETNERTFLIKKLNEYQETVNSLEQQLYENTKRWAQERSAMEAYRDDWYTPSFPRRRAFRMAPLVRSRSIEPGYLSNRRIMEFDRENLPRYSYHRAAGEKTKGFS